MSAATRRWCCSFVGWLLLVAGWWVEPAVAQPVGGPAGWAASFNWSVGTNATVLLASTNTTVSCTVDVWMGDPYNPPSGTVSCAPTILNSLGLAAGSTTVLTNYDYSPYWAQYVCVFTVSDYGDMTLQVDVGTQSSSRSVTAVKLGNIIFSPDSTIAVSNTVTLTATVLPASFVGTFIWGGITNSTGAVVTVQLDYGGHIPALVTLAETGETLGTEVVVISPTLTVFANDDPGVVNQATGFGVLVENDEGLPHTVTWSGAATGTGDTVTYTPTTIGTKTATATVTVGPWTGTASADQNVYSFDLTIEQDTDGNVVNTFIVAGPAGGSFVGSAVFPGEYYEVRMSLGVGTSLLTLYPPDYSADVFEDVTPNPVPAASAASVGPNGLVGPNPGSPEGKIEASIKEATLDALLKAVVDVAVDRVVKSLIKSISDVTITVPPNATSTNYLHAQYYPPGYAGYYTVRSDPILMTVGCSGTTFTAKRVAAWNNLVIDGNFIVQATLSPKDVYVHHLPGIRSPNTGNVKVSACLDDPTRGGSPTYGGITHPSAGRQSTGTALLNTRVIIGGKTLPRSFGCYGIAEFVQGTPFDTLTPHMWEATVEDSLTTASVIVSLTP